MSLRESLLAFKRGEISRTELRSRLQQEDGGDLPLSEGQMGLWMLQSCRNCWDSRGQTLAYRELVDLAKVEPAFAHLVDPDDESFLRPADMLEAIDDFCRKTHQPVPKSPGAYVRCVLESLALKYRLVLRNLERICSRPIHQIRVIGGGSKNRMLNQFTADATGKRVLAGPAEATALGNIGVQILATGEAASLPEVRAIIDRSLPTEVFDPVDTDKWEKQIARFEQYCEMTYA